tara:strand:+ start:600 stop:773 length:174 start_codon:yes stop_codon:yes gene_type:complete
MRIIILIFFLLSGCSYDQSKNIDNSFDKNFSFDLSFEDFKMKLKEYATNSSYPNIDN